MKQNIKEYKILYFANVDTQLTPDEGYRKLYPKDDGWYMLDSDGNEVKITSMIVLDADGDELPQTNKIQFENGLQAIFEMEGEEEGIIKVSIDWLDGDLPIHGNEAHDPDFATLEELLAHINDENPHGIDLSLIHEQGTDETLAAGTEYEVTAIQIWEFLQLATGVSKIFDIYDGIDPLVLKIMSAGVMADTTNNNVDVILPEGINGLTYTFRLMVGENALTVTRSGGDYISFNGEMWTGITTDDTGTWFTVNYKDGVWYVTSDSGLTAANEVS